MRGRAQVRPRHGTTGWHAGFVVRTSSAPPGLHDQTSYWTIALVTNDIEASESIVGKRRDTLQVQVTLLSDSRQIVVRRVRLVVFKVILYG